MLPEVYEFSVGAAASGQRLDLFLSGQGLPISRSQLRRRIDEGEVEVDGRAGKPAQRLRPGQRVRFTMPPPRPVADQPEDIPLDVRYEDRHLLVVNKSAGMVVHPAPGHETGTLVNALLHHCGALPLPPAWSCSGADPEAEEEEQEDEEGAGFSIGGERRPGIVHRLDQGTSGLLVCAKDEQTLVGLQRQFQAHTIHRRYLALVEGVVPAEGTYRTRYGRHPRDRKRFTGRGGSKHAVTHYRVIERLPGASLVEVRLETGRTHQIRVHFSEAGHPVVGDPLYGGRARVPRVREIAAQLGHQALHAQELGFVHPVSEAVLRFSADPPADFAAALAALRA